MSTRNLDCLLHPRSVALIGASTREGTVGAVLARNLLAGKDADQGFAGDIWLVNRRGAAIDGRRAFRSIAELPGAPDLALIATPAATVAGIVAALAARGTGAAIIVSTGFGGDAAAELAVLRAGRAATMRIVGPQGLGVQVPAIGLDASLAHRRALPGRIGFLSQSGTIITVVIDWASSRGIGFSHIVSMGRMADVDFGDMIDWLAADSGTSAILLHLEQVTHARKFISAARAASRAKPVIVVKPGRYRSIGDPIDAHGHARSDAVHDAAFRRAGMLRVEDVDDLFEAAATLGSRRTLAGERLAILADGGGLAVLAADALAARGGHLAVLTDQTVKALTALTPVVRTHNPVDLQADATPERHAAALGALLADRHVDAVLAIHAPNVLVDSAAAADAMIGAARQGQKPVLASWAGGDSQLEARRRFVAAGVPSYDTPHQAVAGFMHLVQWRRNRELLMQTPPSQPQEFTVDVAAARRVIDAVVAAGRERLNDAEAKAVLAAAEIPIVAARFARTPLEAGEAQGALGQPVALKIVSPDVAHRTAVGGVQLDLCTPGEVEAAARTMLDEVQRLRPQARIEGFTLQAMVHRPGAHELQVGLLDDPLFGPVVQFGQGGAAAEVLADRALALPPLNMHLADTLMRDTRIMRLLQGYRDRPAVAFEALALSLVKVAQLAVDLPEIVELQIDPLLADADGVEVREAWLRVDLARRGRDRLSIHPYPRHIETRERMRDGTPFLLRPIRPEDEPRLQAFVDRQDPEDIRLRFFAPIRGLSHALAARLTQIDYDRHMALVAVGADDEFLAVVRLAADANGIAGEFSIAVASVLKGQGLGHLLMDRIIAYARGRGLKLVFGLILRENTAMLGLCRRLGFEPAGASDDPSIVRLELKL